MQYGQNKTWNVFKLMCSPFYLKWERERTVGHSQSYRVQARPHRDKYDRITKSKAASRFIVSKPEWGHESWEDTIQT